MLLSSRWEQVHEPDACGWRVHVSQWGTLDISQGSHKAEKCCWVLQGMHTVTLGKGNASMVLRCRFWMKEHLKLHSLLDGQVQSQHGQLQRVQQRQAALLPLTMPNVC